MKAQRQYRPVNHLRAPLKLELSSNGHIESYAVDVCAEVKSIFNSLHSKEQFCYPYLSELAYSTCTPSRTAKSKTPFLH